MAFPIHNTVKPNGGKLSSRVDGVNIIGYSRAEMGIGESCRIAAKCFSTTETPFGIVNFTGTNSARMMDTTWIHKEIEKPIYNVNVFHINAEQMTEIYAKYGNDIFDNRYNIGYWHWELQDFPDGWKESFSLVNEVWVPSTFVADAIAMKSPVPVVKIPHGIEVRIEEERNRSYFGLPEQAFLFLTMYDLKSYQERKNPKASIEAFKQAFSPDNESVGLVIKVNSAKGDSEEMRILSDLIANYKNIYLIRETLTRNDTNSLLSVTDCYVSLHRSEGFGLGLAEAMYLGKPVIGTNWSSNTDFMDHNNSCPVNYKLIRLGVNHGPYESHQYWADPDVEHASQYMTRLVNDENYRALIAHNGQVTIRQDYSPGAIGRLIEKRLHHINRWNYGG
ncbi:glycosyltransferase family 4 protein [Paenibacillus abyssi]|uniref:glycosyltransferase family 4 protein n=1 Tax=Paenibacillus abyssi TaxID=1340531 RepID=UPI001E65AF9D|nr:glycosyltransferase family 4 protein [Paenibacillus abyssi]